MNNDLISRSEQIGKRSNLNESEIDARREKARELRYKKAVAREINMESIHRWIDETCDALEDVAYAAQNEDIFQDALDGDEEEAFQYRVAFQALMADLEAFCADLEAVWVPDCFDDFFCAVSADNGLYMGYDEYEQDYFGLNEFEAGAGRMEAGKRLERLTKRNLIDAAQRCFQIVTAYLGLKSRFEDLRGAVDIIRAQNDGLLQSTREINALYDQWADAEYAYEIERKIDRLAGYLPDEVWLR